MHEILLPDGRIGRFPPEMSLAEIADILRRLFPPPLPELPEGGSLTRPNGSTVRHDAGLARFFVTSPGGVSCGWRSTLAAAVELADSQPAPTPERNSHERPAAPREYSQEEIASQHWAVAERHIRASARHERQGRIREYREARKRNYGTTR